MPRRFLIVHAAVLGYLNYRFLKLPASIGLTIMGAVASLIVVAIDRLLLSSDLAQDSAAFIAGIDFHTTPMDGMLSLLLFAGALHVDWSEMRRGRWAILALTTVGVLLSTAIVGSGFLLLTWALGYAGTPIWCFVFGALISPTDPVSVMEVVKRTSVSPTLEATLAGESLFNGGVNVVVFAILLEVAAAGQPFSVPHALGLFAVEAGGGIALGLVIGWIAFRAMRYGNVKHRPGTSNPRKSATFRSAGMLRNVVECGFGGEGVLRSECVAIDRTWHAAQG